ncbi:MAG: FKBP-type peptidyl-prolyl cis-trans isomerase [Bacteroidota bacterium]
MKHADYIGLFVLISSIVISSCDSDDVGPNENLNPDSVIVAWLDSLDILATADARGFYYYPDSLNPGGAQVSQSGQVLAFYYQLQDLSGNIIARHQPIDGDSLLYKYASNAVYPLAIDQGIPFMKVGEVFNFILPPDLAYEDVASITTSDGTGIVILQIALVGILGEEEILAEELNQIDEYIKINDLNDTISITIGNIDTTFLNNTILSIDTTFIYDIDSVLYFSSGVRYKRLEEGDGPTPINGDLITLEYNAECLDGTQFQSRTFFEIQFGSTIPNVLIPGFEFGISLMSPSERGLIMIPSSQAYRESARVVPPSIIPELIEAAIIPDYVEQVSPYKTLVFDVTRIN